MAEARTFIRKRRVPRRQFRRQIGLLIRGTYHITEGIEVGEGGMLVVSPVPLDEGQKVVVSFLIPGMVHVVARATVRYLKKEEKLHGQDTYGLQFVDVDFDARRRIRSYVALKSSDEE